MSELKISYDSDGNEFISYKNATYACEENINDIAYNGKCFVYSKGFDGHNGYCSNILTKPTFKDLLIIANDIIEHTEDYDHNFFEGIEIKDLITGNIIGLGGAVVHALVSESRGSWFET